MGVGVTYMSHVKRGVIDDVSQPSSVAGDYSSREHMSLRGYCVIGHSPVFLVTCVLI